LEDGGCRLVIVEGRLWVNVTLWIIILGGPKSKEFGFLVNNCMI